MQVAEEECQLKETERNDEITSPEESLSKPSTSNPLPVLNSRHQSSQSQSAFSQALKRYYSANHLRKRKMVVPQTQRKISKLDHTLDSAMNLLKKVALQSQFTNEFTIFGNHVASQLKTLPYAKSLKLQADIQSLITARVKHQRKKSSGVRKKLSANCPTSDHGTIQLATFFSNWSNSQK